MSDKKQAGTKMLIDVWQNGDFATLQEICHPDVRRHHERMPAIGLDAYQQVVAFYRSAFSDLKYEIASMIEEANKVAILYTVTGTHTGALGTLAPSGVRETVTCVDFYYFRDDKMCDIFPIFDELGLLIKLGAITL